MVASTSVQRWKRITRLLIPLGISGLAIWLISREIDFDAVWASFRKLSGASLVLVLAFFLLGLFLRALACKIILGEGFTLATAFWGMNSGYLLNNVLPFRLGEFGRAALLTGQGTSGDSFMEVLAAIVTERILDILVGAIFFLIMLPLVVENQVLKQVAFIALAVMIIAIVISALAAKNKPRVMSFLEGRFGKSERFTQKVLPKIGNLLDGFKFFLKPGSFVLVFLLVAASWMSSMFQLGVFQRAFIPDGSWWWPALIVPTTGFATALPSAPSGLGVYEAATVAAYSLVGVDGATALALALLMHAVLFILPSIFGLIGIYALGENFTSLIKKATHTRQGVESL